MLLRPCKGRDFLGAAPGNVEHADTGRLRFTGQAFLRLHFGLARHLYLVASWLLLPQHGSVVYHARQFLTRHGRSVQVLATVWPMDSIWRDER